MSKHSRTTPPNFAKPPQHAGVIAHTPEGRREPSEPPPPPPPGEFSGLAPEEVNSLEPEEVAPPLRGGSRDYLDRAGVLRAQHGRSDALAIHAELSEAAADLLAEFDRDMKAYREMLLDALGPILPAYVPTVRVGAVSVRDTFRGGK